MKNISKTIIMIAVMAFVFVSCAKDEETADPTISFQNNQTSLEFDGTNSIDVNITFEAEAEIETVTMVKPTFTGTQTVDITKQMGINYDEKAAGSTSVVYFFKVSTQLLDSLKDAGVFPLSYKFTLTDKDARTTEATFNVTLKVVATPLSVSKSGSFYHIGGTLQGAYDLKNDVLVSASGSAADKFLVNTDVVGDPFTGTWISENGTSFVKANSYNFANATEEAAIADYAAGSVLTTVVPAVNDIYIAKNGSDYYVIKITALDPTDNTCGCGNKGKISFDYKKK